MKKHKIKGRLIDQAIYDGASKITAGQMAVLEASYGMIGSAWSLGGNHKDDEEDEKAQTKLENLPKDATEFEKWNAVLSEHENEEEEIDYRGFAASGSILCVPNSVGSTLIGRAKHSAKAGGSVTI